MKKIISTSEVAPVLKQPMKKRKILSSNEIQPRKFDSASEIVPSGGYISTSDLADTKEAMKKKQTRTSKRKSKKKGR